MIADLTLRYVVVHILLFLYILFTSLVRLIFLVILNKLIFLFLFH